MIVENPPYLENAQNLVLKGQAIVRRDTLTGTIYRPADCKPNLERFTGQIERETIVLIGKPTHTPNKY